MIIQKIVVVLQKGDGTVKQYRYCRGVIVPQDGNDTSNDNSITKIEIVL